jgi:uncharacterized repeat protein (TIGR02543 family)
VIRAAIRSLRRPAFVLFASAAVSLAASSAALAQTWTITATAGANGSITPSGSVLVPNATDTTFFVSPNVGYVVANVLVDGGSVGAVSSYTFTNVTADHTIAASFTVATHSLNLAVNGVGTVAKFPDQPLYNYGTPVQVTATPAPGHTFTGWSGDLLGASNPATVIMTSDKNITGNFDRSVLGYERLPFSDSYTPITTGGGASTILVAADDSTRSIPLPFPFTFSGIPYTTDNFLAINANGFAHFSRTAITTSSTSLSSNTSIYNASAPNATMAPWYDDLSVAAVGSNPAGLVLYQVQGSVGSRVLIVQWTDVSSFANSTGGQPRRINFQLALKETSNEVEFRYGPITGSDHSGFESGSIGIEDSIGGKFLDAVTGSKTVSNGVMTTNKWPKFNFRFLPTIPGTIPGGTYTTGPGGYYVSLSEAVADLNNKGVSGPVIIQLVDNTVDSTLAHGGNTFPILLGPVEGVSAGNTITIEPASGVATMTYRGVSAGTCGNGISASAISTSNEPIFGVIGSDYVTLRNLVMTGGSLVDRGLLVLPNTASDGAQHNTFDNIAISLDRTNTSTIAVQQILQVTPTLMSGTNSFNRYRGIGVTNAYAGISLAGRAPVLDTNCEVSGVAGIPTTIGAEAVFNDIGNGTVQTFGIRALNQANVTIRSCFVRQVTGTGTSVVDGILLENSGSLTTSSGVCEIAGNVVYSIKSTNPSAGRVSGIRASLTANASSVSRIYNNFVFDLNSSSASPFPRRIVGIFLQDGGLGAGATHNVDFNSVRLAPQNLVPSNACFEIATTTGPVIKARNNVFANFTGTQVSASKHYCWITPTTNSLGPAGSVSDRNVLHVNNTVNGYTGLSGTTDRVTLGEWQAVASNDFGSLAGNPQFVDPFNLHINPSLASPVESGGSMFGGDISWVMDDIEGNPRNPTTPDIGADEGNFVPPATNDMAASGIVEPTPGSLMVSGTAFTPRATFENQGSVNQSSIPVRYRIRGPLPANTIIYDQIAIIPSLGVGLSSLVTFPSTSIAVGGSYTLEALSELASDTNAGNNLYSATFQIVGPLSGDYLVGSAQAAPFNTLTGAVSRLNSVGVVGPTRFLLTDAVYGPLESFPITVNAYSGASATNTVTIRPAVGNIVNMSGNNNTAMLLLSGTDYMILEGSNQVGGTSRDWTIENLNGEGSAVVWIASTIPGDGSTNNIVRNLRVRGSGAGTAAGVGIGGPGVGLASSGAGNNSNRVENVQVERAQVGVYASGQPGPGKTLGTIITKNDLDAASPNQLSRAGVMARYEDGIQITENVIGNLSSTSVDDVIGISVGLSLVASDVFTGDEVVNAMVSRNYIHGVSSNSLSEVSAAGIAVARASTGINTIVNNMITGVTSNAYEPSLTVGILVGGGGTTRVWFNSVWMHGDRGDANAASIALAVCDSTSAFNVRNNILANTQTALSGGKGFAIATVAANAFSNLTSNFNDLYSPNAGNDLSMTGGLDNQDDGDLGTLAEWRTKSGRDLQSISSNPIFQSTDDLHINIKTGTAPPVANIGQAISGITNDFDGEPGSRTTTPDIGADEFSTFNLITNIVGQGSVTRNPNASNYESGTNVQITAVPAVGYNFTGWSGAVTGTTNPTTVLMNAHKTVTATFVIRTYTLAVNAGPNGTVAKTPNQATYNHGTAVQVSATPSPLFRLAGWSGDTTGTANPFTVIMNGNKTYTATFEPDAYAINVNIVGTGTVTKQPNQASYANGTPVKVWATPATGFNFTGWTDDTTTTADTLNLVMTRTRNLTATFTIKTYTFALSAGPNGTVSKLPDLANYDHGTSVSVTATPSDGYSLAAWGGDTTGTANPMTVIVTRNRTISATFAINQYTLGVTTNGLGTVAKAPDQPTYDHGTSVALTPTPTAGFHFVGWGGDTAGAANPMTVVMTRNRTITATFGYQIATAAVGSGTVTRSPDQPSYAPGTALVLTAVPSPGFSFTGWSGDTTSTVNPLNLVVTRNRSYTATFAINQYTLNVTNVGNGTNAKVPNQATYSHGTSVQVTATANPFHHFVNWTGDTTETTNPLTVVMTRDRAFAANFAIDTYPLTTNITGSGTLGRNPDLPQYDHGSTLQLTATPAVGWSFIGWSGPDTTTTTNPLTVVMNRAKTINATFTINTYALTVNTVGSGIIAKNPDQALYNHGTNVQLTATPQTGFSFTSWSGAVTGTTNPVSVLMDAPKTVTGTFVINSYSMTVNVVGGGNVAKNPDQPSYGHGAAVVLTANPAVGFTFTNWGGDTSGTVNPLTVIMTRNRSITATFTINNYPLTTNVVGSGSVNRNPNAASYNHGTIVQLTANPAVGFSFTGWSGDTTATTNPLPLPMIAPRTLTATFTLNAYTLTVNAVGNGAVAKNPDQPTYNHGTSVTLTATAQQFHHFVSWTGDTTTTTNPLTIIMTRNRTLTATFVIDQYSLTVNAGANGVVNKIPNQALYDHGSTVQLDAVPNAGFDLIAWGGAATGNADPLSVLMDGNKTISATFGFRLTTNITGSGSVTRNPDAQVYPPSTVVQLTAVPITGWSFTNWSGALTGSTNPSNITMSVARTVTATFTINSYTLTVNSGGNGAVAKSPDQPTYTHGTTVQVTATPNTGYHLQNWTGGATGNTNPLSVLMDGNKTITGVFEINTYDLQISILGPGSVNATPDLPIYPHGTVVQLQTVPLSSGHHFVEWTGAAASFGSQRNIQITVNSPMNIGATFTITENVPPVVQVLTPNGAENLVDGQTTVITWNATDNVGVVAVDIFLSRNGPGGPFEHLAGPMPNDFPTFDWLVDLPGSANAYIRVVARDANGYTGADLSDAAFNIIPRTVDVTPTLPTTFALAAVYPNPMVSQARVAYDVPAAAKVRISVVDLQGREVAVLVDGMTEPGRHQAIWHAHGKDGRVHPGVYFLSMRSPAGQLTRRIVVSN